MHNFTQRISPSLKHFLTYLRWMFINYWDSVNYREHGRVTNLILHDWTHRPYFYFYVKYQWYSYTWLIAENIRRGSPGGLQSTLTLEMLRQQITMALMRLWKRQSFSMYTPCNRIHFIYMWTHSSYTYVNILCVVATGMLFRSTISLTVWQAPSCSDFNTFKIKLSMITVCLPVMSFSLVAPRYLLKIYVPSID